MPHPLSAHAPLLLSCASSRLDHPAGTQVLANLENEYAQCVGKMGMEAERAARVAKKKGSFVVDAAAMAEDKELQQLQVIMPRSRSSLILSRRSSCPPPA